MKKIILLSIVLFSSKCVHSQWSVDHITVARFFPGAVTAQNKVYIAGGYISNTPGVMSNRIDIYDNATGTWNIDSLSSPRGDVACAYLSNKLFFAGGTTNAFGSAKEVDIYNILTSTWSVDSLLTYQSVAIPVVISNKILFAGGVATGGVGVTKPLVFMMILPACGRKIHFLLGGLDMQALQ